MDDVVVLRDILTRMERFFRRIKDYERADYLMDTLEHLTGGIDRVRSRLVGVDFWGGSGSFLDFCVSNYSRHVSDDVAGDNLEHNQLLLELLEYLSASGNYSKRRVNSLARILRKGIAYWSSKQQST